jgi:predicted transcriptional regulator
MTQDREKSRKALIEIGDELRAMYAKLRNEREEGEFTTEEFAQANNITQKAAENFVNYWVREGTLAKRKDVFVSGRFRTVYKKI